ncbi:RimK family alpha-L-glutamate ligase [Streptomyces sp. NPDC060035]|uniref:ATP-grasp domain-containing protein n=1 Tax=Streptomyces sp. NPDC060035 TaxID=3347044 RepID=UPI0036C5BA25
MILAISFRGDLHAIAVQHAVRSRGHEFHIVECDAVSGRASVTWRSHGDEEAHGVGAATVLTSEGVTVSPEEAAVLWWRRAKADQQMTASEPAAAQEVRLVNNDCRGALAGTLAAAFQGEWISPPDATDRASDKVYQLAVARDSGIRVPRTLVSQSREDVVAFTQQVGRTIVKPVVGAPGPSLYTRWIENPESIPESSFEVCPATYQEYIEGRRHIRLNCFGDQMFAALIETDELDWRPDLNVPISRWPVPEDIARRVRTVLHRLGLRMGVVDLKLTPEGEPVWLEVNPQGQFMFLEPLTDEPLTQHFADFLLSATP